MKSFFNILNGNNKWDTPSSSSNNSYAHEKINIEIIKQYKNEIKDIKIVNQAFRLSGLLHMLTHKVTNILKEKNHRIYYEVENVVGRYIIGDNDYIEQILEILINDALFLNTDSEIVLKISKTKNKFLVFDIINEKGLMKKNICKDYVDVKEIISTQHQNINMIAKAKIIAKTMDGSIKFSSSRFYGTHYKFKIPYYEDKNGIDHQKELKKVLTEKKALFIGKDKYDTLRTQYILETYGIHVVNMKLSDFESKKPNLSKFDMAIIRSNDLTYKHISFFKTINQDKKSNLKIIIVHELFEDEEKIRLSKSIAHAELYSPTIIGDVEEILHRIFILKSKAVKGINNLEIFNSKTFTIKGNTEFNDEYLSCYRGAHIAIVEDNNADEKMLQDILMQEGITLFCKQNGAEMIDLLDDEEIDIIFTDITMPIMDGILMTKKIRSIKKYEKIPIISISAMSAPHELKIMEESGINAAISKPIEVKDVYMALENYLVMTDFIGNRAEKIREINCTLDLNSGVLDIEKGMMQAKSNLDYLENLLSKMDYLRNTKESFVNMIYDEEFIALREYGRNALALYEDIYAINMINMFKDLNYFILHRQRAYLIDYVSMYEKNWKELEEEVEKYIHNNI